MKVGEINLLKQFLKHGCQVGDLGTSIFQPLLDELDDLVKMEGNICLWHIQQLQPLVLDPKRPGREGGLSEAVQRQCHRNT